MKTTTRFGLAPGYVDTDRRRILRRAVMVAGAASSGLFSATAQGASRELTALDRASEWLNGPRLTSAGLVGKVVVVQFCTYTCINWLRTLPYVRAWSQRYRGNLVVIGVHTPEFPFEHDIDNVRRALAQMKVDHPVVIDNDYAIWRAFGNNYWPALYFFDAKGQVRDRHFGEGRYDESEKRIQRLLAEAGVATATDVVSVEGRGVEVAADWASLRSPENYLGYQRTANFASAGDVARDRRRVYGAPERLRLNEWALVGEWTVGRQSAVSARASARMLCRFHARDLHLVMGTSPATTPVRYRVTLDGRQPGEARGADVNEGGDGTVVEPRLYQLIRQSTAVFDRTMEIEFLDAGVELFALTFG